MAIMSDTRRVTQRRTEVAAKLTQLRRRMAALELDAVVLEQNANTAWITAGADMYVVLATDTDPTQIVVTADRAYAVTDRVEASRLAQEEALPDLGFTLVIEPWYQRGGMLNGLIRGQRVGGDTGGAYRDISSDLQTLRSTLLPDEAERMRRVGRLTGESLGEVIGKIEPGMTEWAIAGLLDQATRDRGGQCVVNLVASDERIARYRHPLPTDKRVERYVMVVSCFRMHGLVAAATRLVHFGPLPAELEAKARVVAEVDARLIHATRPGRTLADQWALAAQAYRDLGYPEAIEEHHQGGSIGYLTREIIAGPHDATPIKASQAFAWNPSVRGVKSEDTILLGEVDAPAVITTTPGWPLWSVMVEGQIISRPAILVR